MNDIETLQIVILQQGRDLIEIKKRLLIAEVAMRKLHNDFDNHNTLGDFCPHINR